MSVISQLLSRIFYNVDPYPNILPGPGKATQPPARPSDLQPPQAEAIFPGPGSGVRQPGVSPTAATPGGPTPRPREFQDPDTFAAQPTSVEGAIMYSRIIAEQMSPTARLKSLSDKDRLEVIRISDQAYKDAIASGKDKAGAMEALKQSVLEETLSRATVQIYNHKYKSSLGRTVTDGDVEAVVRKTEQGNPTGRGAFPGGTPVNRSELSGIDVSQPDQMAPIPDSSLGVGEPRPRQELEGIDSLIQGQRGAAFAAQLGSSGARRNLINDLLGEINAGEQRLSQELQPLRDRDARLEARAKVRSELERLNETLYGNEKPQPMVPSEFRNQPQGPMAGAMDEADQRLQMDLGLVPKTRAQIAGSRAVESRPTIDNESPEVLTAGGDAAGTATLHVESRGDAQGRPHPTVVMSVARPNPGSPGRSDTTVVSSAMGDLAATTSDIPGVPPNIEVVEIPVDRSRVVRIGRGDDMRLRNRQGGQVTIDAADDLQFIVRLPDGTTRLFDGMGRDKGVVTQEDLGLLVDQGWKASTAYVADPLIPANREATARGAGIAGVTDFMANRQPIPEDATLAAMVRDLVGGTIDRPADVSEGGVGFRVESAQEIKGFLDRLRGVSPERADAILSQAAPGRADGAVAVRNLVDALAQGDADAASKITGVLPSGVKPSGPSGVAAIPTAPTLRNRPPQEGTADFSRDRRPGAKTNVDDQQYAAYQDDAPGAFLLRGETSLSEYAREASSVLGGARLKELVDASGSDALRVFFEDLSADGFTLPDDFVTARKDNHSAAHVALHLARKKAAGTPLELPLSKIASGSASLDAALGVADADVKQLRFMLNESYDEAVRMFASELEQVVAPDMARQTRFGQTPRGETPSQQFSQIAADALPEGPAGELGAAINAALNTDELQALSRQIDQVDRSPEDRQYLLQAASDRMQELMNPSSEVVDLLSRLNVRNATSGGNAPAASRMVAQPRLRQLLQETEAGKLSLRDSVDDAAVVDNPQALSAAMQAAELATGGNKADFPLGARQPKDGKPGEYRSDARINQSQLREVRLLELRLETARNDLATKQRQRTDPDRPLDKELSEAQQNIARLQAQLQEKVNIITFGSKKDPGGPISAKDRDQAGGKFREQTLAKYLFGEQASMPDGDAVDGDLTPSSRAGGTDEGVDRLSDRNAPRLAVSEELRNDMFEAIFGGKGYSGTSYLQLLDPDVPVQQTGLVSGKPEMAAQAQAIKESVRQAGGLNAVVSSMISNYANNTALAKSGQVRSEQLGAMTADLLRKYQQDVAPMRTDAILPEDPLPAIDPADPLSTYEHVVERNIRALEAGEATPQMVEQFKREATALRTSLGEIPDSPRKSALRLNRLLTLVDAAGRADPGMAAAANMTPRRPRPPVRSARNPEPNLYRLDAESGLNPGDRMFIRLEGDEPIPELLDATIGGRLSRQSEARVRNTSAANKIFEQMRSDASKTAAGMRYDRAAQTLREIQAADGMGVRQKERAVRQAEAEVEEARQAIINDPQYAEGAEQYNQLMSGLQDDPNVELQREGLDIAMQDDGQNRRVVFSSAVRNPSARGKPVTLSRSFDVVGEEPFDTRYVELSFDEDGTPSYRVVDPAVDQADPTAYGGEMPTEPMPPRRPRAPGDAAASAARAEDAAILAGAAGRSDAMPAQPEAPPAVDPVEAPAQPRPSDPAGQSVRDRIAEVGDTPPADPPPPGRKGRPLYKRAAGAAGLLALGYGVGNREEIGDSLFGDGVRNFLPPLGSSLQAAEIGSAGDTNNTAEDAASKLAEADRLLGRIRNVKAARYMTYQRPLPY